MGAATQIKSGRQRPPVGSVASESDDAEKYYWKCQARAMFVKLGYANESPGNPIKIQSNSVCLGLGMGKLNPTKKLSGASQVAQW